MSGREDSSGYGRGSEPSRLPGGEDQDSSDESWFEVLNAPLPSETQRERTPAGGTQEDDAGAFLGARRRVEPQPGEGGPSGARGQPRPARVRRGAARRVRRSIKHIDPLSVLKISLITYSVLLVGWLLFVAIFYNFLDGLGLFDTVNSALRGFAYDEVDITLGVVERWAFIAGLIVTIGGSILNVFLALIYNITSRLIGGIEVTFVERDV